MNIKRVSIIVVIAFLTICGILIADKNTQITMHIFFPGMSYTEYLQEPISKDDSTAPALCYINYIEPAAPDPGTKEGIQFILKSTCLKYQVDYAEAWAVMQAENPELDPEAVNRNSNGTKDIGLFQINTCNHDELKDVLGIKDLTDPAQNIEAGVYLLSKLQHLDGHKKFMAYNMGVSGMKRAESRGIMTTRYSRRVMKLINNNFEK